jgi:hypothetical protein
MTRGKKIAGRKRHVVVDTLGLIWALVITPASVQDAEGAKEALTQFRRQVKFPKVIWVDAAYRAGRLVGVGLLGLDSGSGVPAQRPKDLRCSTEAMDSRTNLRLVEPISAFVEGL